MTKPSVTWDKTKSVLGYEREVVALADASPVDYPRRLIPTTSAMLVCVVQSACVGRGATAEELEEAGGSTNAKTMASTIRTALSGQGAPELAKLITSSKSPECVRLMADVTIRTAWGTDRFQLRLGDEESYVRVTLRADGPVAKAAWRAASHARATSGGHLGEAPSEQERAFSFETDDGAAWLLTPRECPRYESTKDKREPLRPQEWEFDVVRADRQTPSALALEQLARELLEANDTP